MLYNCRRVLSGCTRRFETAELIIIDEYSMYSEYERKFITRRWYLIILFIYLIHTKLICYKIMFETVLVKSAKII